MICMNCQQITNNVNTNNPLISFKECKILTISCIDFRFVKNIGYEMSLMGNTDKYDQFVIPGSSLGYNGISGYECMVTSVDKIIELGKNLHNISEISIFDHLDCGAYRLVYTPDQLDHEGEYKLHIQNLHKAELTIKKKYPFIKKVNKYIFDLDYKLIEIK